ncbi:MAG: GNAT family N-acetyltransferase [Gammaproteobacteria bacterium]
MNQETKDIIPAAILSEFKTFPNQGAIWEIIDKKKTGKLYKLPSEAVLIVENCTDPFIFIAGPLDAESVKNVSALASYKTFPMVYCNPEYHSLLLRRGWKFHFRAALSLKNPDVLVPLNPAIDIQPLNNADLLKLCAWYEDRTTLYGSEENFLQHGLGYALCHGTRVVSEAYASIGGGFAELAVTTHPNFQSRGYATHVSSHLIRDCLNANITPQWSCNVNNTASLNTALKLGFEISDYHTFLIPDWAEPHPFA